MEEERTQLMEKFQEITQIQENHVSRHFLESVNWDLNLAIQNYLESHLDEKAGEATTSSLPRSQPQRQGETEELGTEEAPFSIEDNQQDGLLPNIWASETNSSQSWEKLSLKLNEDNTLRLLKIPYTQALEKSKNELKFLVVVLVSFEHEDFEEFCSNVLNDSGFSEYLERNDLLLWVGDIETSESYQVASTLGATTFPFIGLLLQKNQRSGPSRMTIVERIEGNISKDFILNRLTRSIERYSSDLNQSRNQKKEQEMARMLRVQQDLALEESLRRDREKQMKLEEERKRQELVRLEEEKKEREKTRKKQWRTAYAFSLLDRFKEEPSDQNQPLTRLSFRLPSGQRFIRKFRKDDTVETLYQFIETKKIPADMQSPPSVDIPADYVHSYQFSIVSPFPRKELADKSLPLESVKEIWPSANLLIEDLSDDEDEE